MWWYGSFFAGLFHDLPEVTTRDIVSGVKAVLGKETVRKMELAEMERTIIPLLPEYVVPEMKFLLGILNGFEGERKIEVDEFSNRVFEGGISRPVEDIDSYCYKISRSNNIVPVNGVLLKKCDRLVAFAEAVYLQMHGITSSDLKEATRNLYKELNQEDELKGVVNYLYVRLEG
ncbi:HD domain-containing protein [Thermatribacter velox]|uniref:HD domain-containing protein n=1 Tax=Thermatribacter velox TaxID=3039681 RepID=A0ABZ2YCJ3_9BACT